MVEVFEECCKNCLLSPNRIVSAQRAREIITECKQQQIHFVCHKASMNDKNIVCRRFYDTLGQYSQLIRIAERLQMVRFVPQPDQKQLTPYRKRLK